MCAVLDDLVIALDVTVDELLDPRIGPGRPPKLSDGELVCLAVAQVLLGCNSERRWLRFVHRQQLGRDLALTQLGSGPRQGHPAGGHGRAGR